MKFNLKKAIILIFSFQLVILTTGTTRAKGPGEEQILHETLKNGLHVVIVRNILAPAVTTEINYLVGSNETPADFPGTADKDICG